jgi:hypothetical protein
MRRQPAEGHTQEIRPAALTSAKQTVTARGQSPIQVWRVESVNIAADAQRRGRSFCRGFLMDTDAFRSFCI